jgi:calcium-dependent protein kinase
MGQCESCNRDFGDAEIVENPHSGAVNEGDEEIRPVFGRERRFARIQRQHEHKRRLFQTQGMQGKGPIQSSARDGWSGSVRVAAKVSPQNRRFVDEYKLTTTSLGHGMNGEVMLAHSRDPSMEGCTVAVKTLEKKGLSKKELARLLKEVDIYLMLDHGNIARLLQVFDEPERVYLVMEHCHGGTLDAKLKERQRFNELETAGIIKQVLNSVAYCHGRPGGKVVHKDLKLKNFVYMSHDVEATLKLVDFGLSHILRPGGAISNPAGTLNFMAPEVVVGKSHGEACDMWSVGMMAYNLLTGGLPFQGTESETENAIVDGGWLYREETWVDVSMSAQEFIKSLLRQASQPPLPKEPNERLSAEAALRHAWLDVAPAECASSRRPSHDVIMSLEQFAYENEIRRASAAIAVYSDPNLAGPDVQDADREFRHIDSDGNGVITKQELTDVLHQELGITLEKAEWVFKQLDFDDNQEIERSEFLAAVVGAKLLRQAPKVRHAFDRFDITKDGKLELGELTGTLGDKFCGTATSTIFTKLDKNGDRQVDFDEFLEMVVKPEEDPNFQSI